MRSLTLYPGDTVSESVSRPVSEPVGERGKEYRDFIKATHVNLKV